MQNQQANEKLEVFGNNPMPRFGHTITFVSKGKAILFGGATGHTGQYSITGDAYSFDIQTRFWKKLQTSGSQPTPRAVHASCTVEQNQLVIYGGATGGGILASDELYLLDMRQGEGDSGMWTIVPVVGPTPGRRYGLSITYSRPYLVVFGGNSGQETVSDFWSLNVEKSPFSWLKLDTTNSKIDKPMARVYHSSSQCLSGTANGMIVIFGGRGVDQTALNDSWGLRRHRDGRWDWVKAPYRNDKDGHPIGRYQHSSHFIGPLMVVMGGRTNNVGELLPLEVYDTETSEWTKFTSAQRFRHASWIFESSIYVFGGFEHDSPNIPTDSLAKINLNVIFSNNQILFNKICQASSPYSNHVHIVDANPGNQSPNLNNSMTKSNSNSPKSLNQLNNSNLLKNQQNMREQQYQQSNKNKQNNNLSQDNMLHNQFISQLSKPRLYQQEQQFNLKAEHIIQLCDQAQSIIEQQPMVLRLRSPTKVFGDIHGQYFDLMRFFELWGQPCDGQKDMDIESFDYLFLGDYVDRGSHSLEVVCLLLSLKIRYPNQFHLIRGNHEDRWININFGFAEECIAKFDEDINDEDSVFQRVNRLFEYLPLAAIIDDKIICLHGGIGSSLNYIEEIEQLQRPLEVVHEVSNFEQQLVVDILWSDPTDTDTDTGIQPNTVRDPQGSGNIVKFGPDRVQHFLGNNHLSLIIRAHECVMDGFERFAGGTLITVFSATDYCGKHKNAGAVLIIKTNMEIIPKLIYPSNLIANNWLEDEESLKKRPPTPPRWKNNGQR